MLRIDNMAQQDKTDWYWNGVLAGAVNNLYYEFINVDVTHVPYTATHRNSSFFLKNRLAYVPSDMWAYGETKTWWDITDIKVIWDSKCDKTNWEVYALAANPFRTKWRVYKRDIKDGCTDIESVRYDEFDAIWCWDWKLFVTDYIKWKIVEDIIDWDCPVYWYTWIQINEYEGWTTHWYFSDECIEESGWEARFSTALKWYFLLVYDSKNDDDSWFAWQVRLITDVDSKWRLVLEAPWQGFATLSSDSEEKEVKWSWVKYYIFKDWWEVVGYSTWKNITLITNADWSGFSKVSPYSQLSPYLDTNIIWVASAANKIFVLTDNWWIHYTNTSWGYDKFFIQDDVFAWIDKTSITSYRDFVVTFWKNHLGICVPDDTNRFYTVYDQSQTVWLWSRYSYWEYDWDLLFVSNDKRLLALWVAWNTWKYMLQYEDVWELLNSKLSVLLPGDEVFVWDDRWDLKVFVNYRSNPYVALNDEAAPEYVKEKWWSNTSTHIYKFDKLFKVWTEDHLSNFCLCWVIDWLYFWENWIYVRDIWGVDKRYWNVPSTDIVAKITAYLIENETDWIGWTGSWLANRPKLYNLAKLNRLITVLGPWKYSENTKIHITSYVNWIWTEYEFPIGAPWDEVNNLWVSQISKNYVWDDTELEECQLEVVKDNQTEYRANCTSSKVTPYSVTQDKPWCDSYREILLPSHWVCIDDSIYKLAPSMPLVTNLGESQSYATQIKIELISQEDDITFGGRLWEMFVAPLFSTWPDWEYQLQPETDC